MRELKGHPRERERSRHALKITLAYSFHAPSSSRSLPSLLGTRRNGPISIKPPSNELQPGPPLNLRRGEKPGQSWALTVVRTRPWSAG